MGTNAMRNPVCIVLYKEAKPVTIHKYTNPAPKDSKRQLYFEGTLEKFQENSIEFFFSIETNKQIKKKTELYRVCCLGEKIKILLQPRLAICNYNTFSIHTEERTSYTSTYHFACRKVFPISRMLTSLFFLLLRHQIDMYTNKTVKLR